MATKTTKKKKTKPIEHIEEFPEYVLDIQDLAKARGIEHAYDLWKRIGGSLESAADLWNGRTMMVGFRGTRNVLGKLCAVLGCKPGRLFKEVESGDK